MDHQTETLNYVGPVCCQDTRVTSWGHFALLFSQHAETIAVCCVYLCRIVYLYLYSLIHTKVVDLPRLLTKHVLGGVCMKILIREMHDLSCTNVTLV